MVSVRLIERHSCSPSGGPLWEFQKICVVVNGRHKYTVLFCLNYVLDYTFFVWQLKEHFFNSRNMGSVELLCCAGRRSLVYISKLHFWTKVSHCCSLLVEQKEALRWGIKSHPFDCQWNPTHPHKESHSLAALSNSIKLSTGLYRQPRYMAKVSFYILCYNQLTFGQ